MDREHLFADALEDVAVGPMLGEVASNGNLIEALTAEWKDESRWADADVMRKCFAKFRAPL